MCLCSVPDTPTDLTVSNVTTTTFTLSWNTGGTVVVNKTYVSYTGHVSSTFIAVSNLDLIRRSHTFTGVTPGDKYITCVTVASYNVNSSSNCTEVVTGMFCEIM